MFQIEVDSMRYEADLDMRMDQNSELKAYDIINNYSFEQNIF